MGCEYNENIKSPLLLSKMTLMNETNKRFKSNNRESKGSCFALASLLCFLHQIPSNLGEDVGVPLLFNIRVKKSRLFFTQVIEILFEFRQCNTIHAKEIR